MDYDASKANLLWLVANGVMSPVEGENGQLLAAEAEMTRGELAVVLAAIQ